MPKLPSKHQFDTARFSSVRPTAEAFGSSEGAGLANLGASVNRVASNQIVQLEKRERENNEREAKQLETNYLAKKNEFLYGEDGIYNQRGNNALAQEADAAAGLKEIRNNLLSSTERTRVREQMDFVTERDQVNEAAKMDRFINQQRDIASLETSSARIAEYAELAAVDPTQVKHASDVIFNEVAQQGERFGWSPEVVKQKMLAESTNLHSGVVDNLLVNDPKAAKSYLKSAKSQMTNSAYLKYQTAVDNFSVLGAAQGSADRIMSQVGLEDQQLLALARKEGDPKVREKTVSLVKARISERDRFEENNRKAIYRNAAQEIITGEMSLSEWVESNPSAMVEVASDPNKWNALERAELRRMEGERYTKVDTGKYVELLNLPPSAIVDLDPNDPDLLGNLTKQQAGRLETLIKSKRNQIDRVAGSTRHINHAYKILNRHRPEFNWNDANLEGTDDDARTMNSVLNRITSDVQEQYLDNGVEPSNDQIEEIVVQNAEVIQQGGSILNPFTWFRDEVDATAWQDMTEDERQEVQVDWEDISPVSQRMIEEDIQNALGVTVPTSEKERVASMFFLKDNEGLRQWLQEQRALLADNQ